MREMGGLRRAMPITSMTMLLGCLALAGIVPFSGFFSKGEVLTVAFEAGTANPAYLVLWALGVATAFLTAFYAFRLWFMTFRGEYRGHEHLHESPGVMTGPLLVLGAFTLISGLSAYAMGGFGNLIFFEEPHAQLPLVGAPVTEYLLEGLSLGVAIVGLVLAWAVYDRKRIPAERFTAGPSRAFVHTMLSHRYWIDDAYDAFGAKVVYGFAKALDWFDRRVIDGIVNAFGRGGLATATGTDVFDRRVVDGVVNLVSRDTVRASLRLRQRQTGQVQSYVWVIAIGIVVVIALVFGFGLYVRLFGGR
jgi:NADH-quinone oxidoreductase subunit L